MGSLIMTGHPMTRSILTITVNRKMTPILHWIVVHAYRRQGEATPEPQLPKSDAGDEQEDHHKGDCVDGDGADTAIGDHICGSGKDRDCLSWEDMQEWHKRRKP